MKPDPMMPTPTLSITLSCRSRVDAPPRHVRTGTWWQVALRRWGRSRGVAQLVRVSASDDRRQRRIAQLLIGVRVGIERDVEDPPLQRLDLVVCRGPRC